MSDQLCQKSDFTLECLKAWSLFVEVFLMKIEINEVLIKGGIP